MSPQQSREPRRIDLNADLGEERGDDLALLDIVTSANLATGAHAGGGVVLTHVTHAAVARGIVVGAHPSYRDRAGFGRASLLHGLRADREAREAFVTDLVEQILVVAVEVESAGGTLGHVKPHGSLYNEAVADPFAAAIVLDAVDGAQRRCAEALALVTQPGGELAALASDAGFRVIAEGFADRAYAQSGHLVPRSEPGAVHHDPDTMVRQALDLAHGRVRCVDGSVRAMPVTSLCVHGDTAGAVLAARAIRDALERARWVVAAPSAQSALRPADDTRVPDDDAGDRRPDRP